MAEHTTNFNLEKQQENEFININGINSNFDTIDTKLKEAQDKAVGAYQQDSKDNTVSFTQAIDDVELQSGATHAVLWGVAKKKFADAVYLAEGEATETAIPRDADTLGGQPKSYYEGIIQDIKSTKVSKDGSIAMNSLTVGNRKAGSSVGTNSLAQGIDVEVPGNYAASIGYNNTASGQDSLAGGYMSRSTANHSLSFGRICSSSGYCADSFGELTEASGYHAFATGYSTKAQGNQQAVFGRYNIPNTTDIFQIGNGTSDSDRKNALSVDANGNVTLNGGIKPNFSLISDLTGIISAYTGFVIQSAWIRKSGNEVLLYVDIKKTDNSTFTQGVVPIGITNANYRPLYYYTQSIVASSVISGYCDRCANVVMFVDGNIRVDITSSDIKNIYIFTRYYTA